MGYKTREEFEAHRQVIRDKESEILANIDRDYLCCARYLNFEYKPAAESELHVYCDIPPSRRNDAVSHCFGFRIAKFILPNNDVIPVESVVTI